MKIKPLTRGERTWLVIVSVIFAFNVSVVQAGAYAALAEAEILVTNNQETTEQLVTLPAPIISSPVQKEVVISGPVQTQVLQTGPIFSSDPPLVGSIDWMAQEKAEKDKLRSDAARKQAELEAEAARVKAELETEIARLEKIAEDTKTLNE
jgi:hypothetical protein